MQTYQTKRKSAPARTVRPQAKPVTADEMLHLSGAGAPQPMSPALREKFEPGFSADFSNIRISRGHIPEEMGVQAVARGTDILLDSSAGMDVLGHELAHVVQQAQGRVQGGYPVVENAALEHEADVMGARVASGLTAQAGPQNGFGGELTTIAPMSGASAPAQCKSKEEKEAEKAQKEQQKQMARDEQQRQQWHSMLSPSAQRYIKPVDMIAQPTISHAEMNQQVLDRQQYLGLRNHRTEMATEALRKKYNDPNARPDNSGAGSMGRRIEALFDASGTEEADSYNQTMIDTLDQVNQIAQTTAQSGTVSMSDDMVKNMGTTFAPLVRQILNAGGSDAGKLQQYAKQNYADSKFLIGKLHALPDVLKSFDAQSKERVIQAAGFSGSYQDYLKMSAPVNNAFSEGWKESGNEMGIGANVLFRGIEHQEGIDTVPITPAPLPPQVTRPRPAPGPSLAPKPGQQYTTQADLPQSGPGWSHTGSWKHTASTYVNMDDRMDLMPGGSDASAFHRYFPAEESPAPKKKKGLFSRLFGR